MRKPIILGLFVFLFFSASAQSTFPDFQYQTGDLVFQDLDCGDLCDAIEKITPAVKGKHFSHIGIVYVLQDSVYVIEAIGEKVHLTSLSQFLQRQTDSNGHPKVIVGRLKKEYKRLNGRAVGFALQQKDKPYDDEFEYDNGKYYCSELVYDAYKAANNNTAFFQLYPMTFKDPDTHKTMQVWKDYYKKLGKKIPEGRLGCNPGSIAMSDAVELVKTYY